MSKRGKFVLLDLRKFRQKRDVQISNADWYKKAKFLTNMVVLKKHHLDQENDKLLLYVRFELRQKLLMAAHVDLTGHGGVKKCKEKLMECYFWLNMYEDILKHIKECLKCQTTNGNKFPTMTLHKPKTQCNEPHSCSATIHF
jgi:hypothetical protein